MDESQSRDELTPRAAPSEQAIREQPAGADTTNCRSRSRDLQAARADTCGDTLPGSRRHYSENSEKHITGKMRRNRGKRAISKPHFYIICFVNPIAK